MAAAAIPIGASLLAPEVAGAAAPMLAGTLFEGAAPWLAGAGLGGLGSALTGGNPLKGALFGGLSGGIGDAVGGSDGFGGLFKSGAMSGGEAISPELAAADPSLVSGGSDKFLGGVSKYLPYAGLAGASMLMDNSNKTKQVGPTPQSHPSNPGEVSPLDRQYQNVDPNSYYTSSANRNYFSPYSLQPKFMAKGGQAKSNKNSRPGGIVYFSEGGSSSASSSNIPRGRQIKGAGDGRSDSIPAMLSDGEFVVSAPVVSALGNGSNDAGAKRLGKMQKTVIQKHYKGNKPQKAMGLGSYVH